MQLRQDTIQIQSIASHQLSSSIFCNMILHAWYASKLCNERYIFINVNEVCFPVDILKTPSSCTKSSYVCCSRCRNIFCFSCLYDNYHSGLCIYDYITALIVHIVLVVFFLLVISIKIFLYLQFFVTYILMHMHINIYKRNDFTN